MIYLRDSCFLKGLSNTLLWSALFVSLLNLWFFNAFGMNRGVFVCHGKALFRTEKQHLSLGWIFILWLKIHKNMYGLLPGAARGGGTIECWRQEHPTVFRGGQTQGLVQSHGSAASRNIDWVFFRPLKYKDTHTPFPSHLAFSDTLFCVTFNHQVPALKNDFWASLVAQWLRVCLPMQGTRVRALVWEDPTCRGATRPVSHNYRACASGACAPQQERPR